MVKIILLKSPDERATTKQVCRDKLVVYLSFSPHNIYIALLLCFEHCFTKVKIVHLIYIYIYIYIYTYIHTYIHIHTRFQNVAIWTYIFSIFSYFLFSLKRCLYIDEKKGICIQYIFSIATFQIQTTSKNALRY